MFWRKFNKSEMLRFGSKNYRYFFRLTAAIICCLLLTVKTILDNFSYGISFTDSFKPEILNLWRCGRHIWQSAQFLLIDMGVFGIQEPKRLFKRLPIGEKWYTHRLQLPFTNVRFLVESVREGGCIGQSRTKNECILYLIKYVKFRRS